MESCTDISEAPRAAAHPFCVCLSKCVWGSVGRCPPTRALSLLHTPPAAPPPGCPLRRALSELVIPWVYMARLCFFTVQPLYHGPHCHVPVLPAQQNTWRGPCPGVKSGQWPAGPEEPASYPHRDRFNLSEERPTLGAVSEFQRALSPPREAYASHSCQTTDMNL